MRFSFFPYFFQYPDQHFVDSVTMIMLHVPQAPDQTNYKTETRTYTNPLTFTKRQVHVVGSASFCLIVESLWVEFFWIREVLRISVQPQHRNHHLNALLHDKVCVGDRIVLGTFPTQKCYRRIFTECLCKIDKTVYYFQQNVSL